MINREQKKTVKIERKWAKSRVQWNERERKKPRSVRVRNSNWKFLIKRPSSDWNFVERIKSNWWHSFRVHFLPVTRFTAFIFLILCHLFFLFGSHFFSAVVVIYYCLLKAPFACHWKHTHKLFKTDSNRLKCRTNTRHTHKGNGRERKMMIANIIIYRQQLHYKSNPNKCSRRSYSS